jgi:acyl-CoA synthetase (AMP-forming)/AMP-acid ligase II
MNLADVLDPRDDDATTVAVYTTTEEVTRAELRARAEALTALLRERGLRPGQAVGVMLPNGPDIVAALFGIWFAGGVYVPLNPRLSADELTHVVAEDRPAAIVTRRDDAGRVTDVPVVLASGAGTWEAPGALDSSAPTSATSVAAISFTSGTTGRPKPVPLLHDNVLGLIDGVLGTLRSGATTSVTDTSQGAVPKRAPMPNLIPTSLSLWAGIYNVIFAFRTGAAVIIMDRFDTRAFAGFVERFQLRSTVLPPAAMTMLSDDESITSLAPLRYVRSITAPLSPLQARRFRDRFGVFVLNGWGQTEIGGEIVGWSAQDAKEFGETHLGAVGRPHENVRLRISEDARDGVGGEILVRTPMIDERSATGDDMDGRLVDGWFHTGDLGRIDREGFLWIEGRVSDMINRGGLKVFPEEVAEVVRLAPDVAECAVAGIPDDRLGEVPWAFVVPREGAKIDPDALEALCREHLAPYKVPVRFEVLDALPRNEVGKVLLRELVAIGSRNS